MAKVTLTQIRKAHDQLMAAQSRVNELAEKRNALIRKAVEEGTRQNAIARELEVGKARIGQIVHPAAAD